MFITAAKPQNHFPKRIISLVPSLTELLADIGLANETIGITKFCVHPTAWFQSKTKIGGTKNANLEKIISLQPDLIICNKEENVKEQIELLAEEFPVYLSDVSTYSNALKTLKEIGTITDKVNETDTLIKKIIQAFDDTRAISSNTLSTAYLIWREPYMTVGGDTFISSMMDKAGLDNIFKDEIRYPTLSIADLVALKPQLILLSSEPYPFAAKHIEEMKKFFPSTKIILADGEMFSWYGSRMLYAADYFKSLRQQILLA
jgi:ABC-type Fe3+-hydroxamate transport system substrate-binding protein